MYADHAVFFFGLVMDSMENEECTCAIKPFGLGIGAFTYVGMCVVVGGRE
jgi:hypothetical protein